MSALRSRPSSRAASLRSRLLLSLALSALALPAVGCKKKEEVPPPAAERAPTTAPPAGAAVRVTEVQLGNALAPDKRITSPQTSFGTKDTIFVSVVTEGSSAGSELKARWTYGPDGQLVDENTRSIAPTGMAVTEFSIKKPDGWPPGEYKVEISLDGNPVETRTFQVQ